MLHLPELAKQGQRVTLFSLSERLPSFLMTPCQLTVTYQIESKDDFYLIHLRVVGDLRVICQRCLKEFNFPYDNPTIIAVCRSDERAEQLLEHYECIVSSNWQVNLDELVIDELHLYAPQTHPMIENCDSEIDQFLGVR